mmetsp:Transcript_102868/g.319986  ORF Transcript_102868/g.319986 Transcript_102868/m.319986 type:complete len:257 (+) Transcript_102868:1143-1913(+)
MVPSAIQRNTSSMVKKMQKRYCITWKLGGMESVKYAAAYWTSTPTATELPTISAATAFSKRLLLTTDFRRPGRCSDLVLFSPKRYFLRFRWATSVAISLLRFRAICWLLVPAAVVPESAAFTLSPKLQRRGAEAREAGAGTPPDSSAGSFPATSGATAGESAGTSSGASVSSLMSRIRARLQAASAVLRVSLSDMSHDVRRLPRRAMADWRSSWDSMLGGSALMTVTVPLTCSLRPCPFVREQDVASPRASSVHCD